MKTALTTEEVLQMVPQQEPFRFIDGIDEIDTEHIVAHYRFRPDADFYRGHFPGNPVTPGVILVESMAQASVVALGIYNYALELGKEEAQKVIALFTDANIEFSGMVKPGERVVVKGEKLFFRRRKMRSKAEMYSQSGDLVCSGIISGMGVKI